MPWYRRDAESAWYASMGFMLMVLAGAVVVGLVVWFGFVQPGRRQIAEAPSTAGVAPSDGQLGQQGEERGIMKSSTEDKTEGRFREAEGKVKEMAGKITDNPKLETKGKAEKTAGKTQQKIGEVKKVFGR